jgi:integrase
MSPFRHDNCGRDYAIMLAMARLAVLGGEVARLLLSDIDWRAAQVTVHGKSGQVEETEQLIARTVGARKTRLAIGLGIRACQPGHRTCSLPHRSGWPSLIVTTN